VTDLSQMPGRLLLYDRSRYLIGYSAGKPWPAAQGRFRCLPNPVFISKAGVL